jgi:hypothetical protein
MNTADLKGDTARGARAIASANARRWDREARLRREGKLSSFIAKKLDKSSSGDIPESQRTATQ